MYPIKISEESKKRSKLERYQDILYSCRLFDKATLTMLFGLCGNTIHDIKQLTERSVEKGHMETYKRGIRIFYKLTEKGEKCNDCWFSYLKSFNLDDIFSTNFELDLNSIEIIKNGECFDIEKKHKFSFSPRKIHSKFLNYLDFLKFLEERPRKSNEIVNEYSWERSRIFKNIGLERGHIKIEEKIVETTHKALCFYLTKNGINCIDAFGSYINLYNLSDLI